MGHQSKPTLLWLVCLVIAGIASDACGQEAPHSVRTFQSSDSQSGSSNSPHLTSSDSQELPVAEIPLRLRDAIIAGLHQLKIAKVLNGSSIRLESMTAYDTEAERARRDETFAIFDPSVTVGYVGSEINEPPSSFFGPGISQPNRRDEGDFVASLKKLWQTGATTTFAYEPPLGYLYLPGDTSDGFNPIYSSAYVLDVRQPLLRGFGFQVNQAPLRVAQLRYEQSIWDFKRTMLANVRSIEQAYWELQAARVILAATEAALPLAQEAVRIEEARVLTEWAIRGDVARAKVQLTQIQQDIVELTNSVALHEFRLRRLLGYPLVDNCRIIPIDPPVQNFVPHDVAFDVSIAELHRPDLVQRRLAVKIRELQCVVARNGVKPKLDLQALYRANGVGDRLDDALKQAGSLNYSDWTLGITFNMPLGNRAPRAELRATEWELARDRAVLREAVANVELELSELARDLQTAQNRYQLARQQAESASEWLELSRIRFSHPQPGSQSPDALLILLFDYQTALRANISAVAQTAALLAEMNTIAARYEEELGTLLDHWTIEIDQDPVTTVQSHLREAESTPIVLEIDPRFNYRVGGFTPPIGLQSGWTGPRMTRELEDSTPPQNLPAAYHQNSVRR